jgi:hypothetical protein
MVVVSHPWGNEKIAQHRTIVVSHRHCRLSPRLWVQVSGQRNAVGIANLMPETTHLQEKMNAAKARGDTAEQMATYGELQKVRNADRSLQ